MAGLGNVIRGSLLASLFGLIVASKAQSGMILEQYEFQGQAGTETTLAPSVVTSGLAGLGVAESSGLTPSAGTNSIAASGWNVAGQYYSLGFTVSAGYTATVTDIVLTSRSSGTGPGFINVLASVGGGALTTVGSITQTGTAYNDEDLVLTSPVTAAAGQSVVFYFEVANQTSAAGATIGSTGTFRIGDYDPTGAASPTPFTFDGSITKLSAAVPEPASLAMLGLGLAAVATIRRIRRPSW